MADFAEADVNSLADKIAGLDLTQAETSALQTLIANAAGEEVAGFGWDEGVAAVTAPSPKGISAELGAGLRSSMQKGLFPSRN